MERIRSGILRGAAMAAIALGMIGLSPASAVAQGCGPKMIDDWGTCTLSCCSSCHCCTADECEDGGGGETP